MRPFIHSKRAFKTTLHVACLPLTYLAMRESSATHRARFNTRSRIKSAAHIHSHVQAQTPLKHIPPPYSGTSTAHPINPLLRPCSMNITIPSRFYTQSHHPANAHHACRSQLFASSHMHSPKRHFGMHAQLPAYPIYAQSALPGGNISAGSALMYRIIPSVISAAAPCISQRIS